MSIMEFEIKEEIEVLKETYKNNVSKIIELKEKIKSYDPTDIVLVARGSSMNAGLYFKYLAEIYSNYRVSLEYPSVLTIYDSMPKKGRPLYIGISQGGKGEDIRRVIIKAKELNYMTICITNDFNSPLSTVSDYTLGLYVGLERSMAATKSFQSELLVLGMLAFSLSDKDFDKFNTVPSILSNILKIEEDIKLYANKFINIDNMYVLSRGLNYPIAKEACCKLQETCFINANGYSVADFMHGPLALVCDKSNILLFIDSDNCIDSYNKLFEVSSMMKPNILLITTNNQLHQRFGGILLDVVDNDLTIFEFTFALQLLASNISNLKNLDPDTSRNLNKYTKTI